MSFYTPGALYCGMVGRDVFSLVTGVLPTRLGAVYRRSWLSKGIRMIRELQFFIRLCRDKSIRKASQALFITPQGLSKAMKSLESELGVQLFTRSSEGIEPTAAGKLVAKKAAVIVEEYTNLTLEIRQFKAGVGDQVRIVVAGGLTHVLQPDYLYEYQESYPEVELQVGEYPDLTGEQAVFDGEAEIGFTIGPVDKRKFVSHKLMDGKLSVIFNKSHPLSTMPRLTLRDLAKEKWVLPNDKFKTYHNIMSKCAELGLKPKIALLAADIGVLFKFCERVAGIGFSSELALADSGYDSLKAIPLVDDSVQAWDTFLITKRRGSLSPAARGFVEFVRGWFKKNT